MKQIFVERAQRLITPKTLRIIIVLYCCFIVAQPVAAFLSILNVSIDKAYQSETTRQNAAAQTYAANFEKVLNTADEFTYSLLNLNQVSEFIKADGQSASTLVGIMKRLIAIYPSIYDTGMILNNNYIYSRKSETIMNKDSGYIHLQNFYDKQFARSGYDYAAWKAQILENEEPFFFSPATQAQSMLYSRRIGYGPRDTGRIFFSLDSAGLLAAFQSISSIDHSAFAILDADDQIIYAYHPAEMEGFEAMAAAYRGDRSSAHRSDDPYVYYHAATTAHKIQVLIITPFSYIRDTAFEASIEMMREQIPIFILNLVVVVVLILFCIPHVNRTLTIFSPLETAQTINPFLYIRQATANLVDSAKAYEELLKETRKELQAATISELIFSKNQDEIVLTQKLSRYGITLSAPHYRAIILILFSTDNNAPMTITQEIHIKILDMARSGASGCLQYLCMKNSEQFYFLALLPEADDRFAVLQQTLYRICNRISNEIGCKAVMFIGNEYGAVSKISYSFKEAHKLVATSVIGEDYLLYNSLDGKLCFIYHYTSNDEQILQQLVKAGDDEKLRQYLMMIYQNNQQLKDNAKSFEAQLLYAHMLHTLLMCGYDGTIDDALRYELYDLPMDVFFKHILKCYGYLAQKTRESIEEKNSHEQRNIMKYIHDHISDYNLCQASVAECFGISEQKLANIIHERTDMSFSSYLERLRLEHSLVLLGSTSFTVSEISLQVGYANDKSFRRAFKRYFGKTPSEMRGANAGSDAD